MSAARSGVVVTIVALLMACVSQPVNAIEQPEYEVVEEVGELQIRKYPARIVARTLVAGPFEDAGSQGFKRLAGYIFGGNGQDQKIAMTAPVEVKPNIELSSDGHYWVTFSMPREYSRDELPVPSDPRVQIEEVPEKYLAVLPYRGNWSEQRYRTHEALLLSLISDNKTWVEQGKPSWARYNPPFVPWFLRRNEVAIEVSPAS